ncbi:MAG: hypothetical protein QMC89_01955 [Candidatus Hodarchaeaceae archaeon]|nr:hypothetical protein [Candidatus Hodarchaeaceae archaeon]
MVLKGKGRLINRPTQTGRRTYDKFFIYIPTELARDSAFPFRPGDEVEVEIDMQGKRLLIGHAPTYSITEGRRPKKTSWKKLRHKRLL